MSLAQPLWLLLALLVGVLIWFHRQRRAVRAVEVGSLHLWRRLALHSAPKARPRARLSPALLLQGLILLLVALALARPSFGPATPGGDVLLLVEAGRAMRATDRRPERFGAAISAAQGEVRGRTSVLLVSDLPVPLALNRSDGAGVRAALEDASAGDGTPDWAAAARTAQAWMKGNAAQLIVYASPGQAQSARTALSSLNPDVRVIGSGAPNAALTRLTVTPGSGQAPWELNGVVRNFGPAGGRNVTVELGGRVLSAKLLKLAQDADTPFSLRFTPGEGGVLSARLDAADVLPADDEARVVLRPVALPLRVSLVGPAATPHGPAARGAAALPGAVVVRGTALPAAGSADLLIVTDPALRPADVPPAVPVTVWLNAPTRGAVPDSVLAWDSAERLGQGVAWGELGALSRAPVLPWPTGTALLTGRTGPLIEVRRVEGLTEVRVNMSLAAGEWTQTPAFPVFLANLARLARPDAGERIVPPCQVGWPCRLPAGARNLQAPEGVPSTAIGEGMTGPSFIPWRAGVYRVDGQLLAVNRLAGADADLRGAATSSTAGPSRSPLRSWRDVLAASWRPLLLVALLALVTEALLLLRAEPSLRRGRWRALSRPQRRMLALHALAGVLLLLAVLDVPLPAPGRSGVSAQILLPGSTPEAGQVTVWGAATPSLDPTAESAGDLAAALEVAAAALPAGAPRTLHVQDGPWPLSARVPDVLAKLRAQGTAVIVEPSAAAPPALRLSVFETPEEATPGQGFVGQVVAVARESGTARLSLRRADTVLLDTPVTLKVGLNRLALPLREDVPGTAGYVLTLGTANTTVQAFAATRVTDAGAVLVVSPDAGARRGVIQALRIQNIASREVSPAELTPELVAGAGRIALLDTPAQALEPGVRAALEGRVRSGGHLLLAGGSLAFGPGGYLGTALETLSPLSGRVVRDLPRLALGLALDKSGSMNELVGGEVTKLDLIKSAALNSTLLLSPESDVVVIAFDSAPKLAVPLTRAANREQIRAQIGRIEAEGGTVVKRALEATLKELSKSAASRKHLILLTDGVDGGIFSPEEYRRLVRRIRATGITVSTVSVGSGMHIALMRDIATWGEGRFAQAQDWRDVPSLLARDTLELGESAVKTGTFAARWPGAAPVTLSRYVRTTLKPGATPLGQIGAGKDADPLAATWRVGLGSVSALAVLPTDAGNTLARQPDFPALLAPLVRGSGSVADGGPPAPTLTRDGADMVVTSPTSAALLDGPQGQRSLSLQPDGQGGYHTRLYAPPPGGYSVRADRGDRNSGSAALGLPQPGASLGGLLPPSGSATRSAGWSWQGGWPVFALLALLTFFAGLALRYLPEHRSPPVVPASPGSSAVSS